MARPRLELDEEKIKQLAAIHCSLAEIAAVMDCDVKTLTNRYSQVIEKGREHGKSSLKKKQFEIAMKGNVTMLIWLGKIVLDQREPRDENRSSGPITAAQGAILEEMGTELLKRQAKQSVSPA